MVGKAENDPPVCANRYRPKTFLSTFELVQPKTRHVHIGRGKNSAEPRENIAELVSVFGDDAARVVVFVKAFQPLMAYRPYHPEP